MSSSALTLRVNQREYNSSELRAAVAKWRNEERFLHRMWQIGLDYLPEGQMCHHYPSFVCQSHWLQQPCFGLLAEIHGFKSQTVTPAQNNPVEAVPFLFVSIFVPFPGDFPKSCRSLRIVLLPRHAAESMHVIPRSGSSPGLAVLFHGRCCCPLTAQSWWAEVSSVPQKMA